MVRHLSFVYFLIFLGLPAQAENISVQDVLKTPATLSTQNTTLSFKLDTTWHWVHGKINEINGRVWLEPPSNIQADINVPVSQIDTGINRRNNRMREVMLAEKFPDIVYHLKRVEGLPDSLESNHPYSVTLIGEISIRGVRKELETAGTVTASNGHLKVAGDFPLNWRSFEVEDPSIVVAKVQPEMKIHFEVNL